MIDSKLVKVFLRYKSISFWEENCTLSLIIKETWPKTEVHAVCAGVSGAGSGGIFKLTFPSLTFKDNDPRKDTLTTIDTIKWFNTFQLDAKDGLEDTGCALEALAA